MKKIKLIGLSMLFTVGALAGCTKSDDPKPDPKPDPEHVHTFEDGWTTDANKHWHKATCGHDVKGSEASHEDKNGDFKCDVCGFVMHEHTFESAWSNDANSHWHKATCGHDVKDSLADHVDSDGDFKCDVCSYVMHEHTFGEEWLSDANSHWHPATCGHNVKGSEAAHIDSDEDFKCDVCQYVLHTHTFSDNWTSDANSHWHAATCGHDVKTDVESHSLDAYGTCSVCSYYDPAHDERRVFTAEKLGKFIGTFYAQDAEISISVDGIVIKEGLLEITLDNDLITGSGFDTVATYKGVNDEKWTLKWENAYWDVHNQKLMLPTLILNENSIQLQPSIKEAQGWYDGWDGEMDPGTYVYVIADEFVPEVDAFQMYFALFDYSSFGRGLYLRSSFVEINGNVELGISEFDSTDIELGYNEDWWNYYLYKDSETGRLYLADIYQGEVYLEWWARPSYFLGEYLKASTLDYSLGEIFENYNYDYYSFNFDEDAKTVEIGWDDPVEYVEGFDELGSYVIAGDKKIRGTSYGISVECQGEIEECPVFFLNSFAELQFNTFVSGEKSIEFVCDYDWDTWEPLDYIAIDGEPADKSYLAFVNNEVMLAADKGDNIYYLALYNGTDAVLVYENGKPEIYVNSYAKAEFVGDFYASDFSEASIDDDLVISFDETTYNASLAYNNTYGVILVFEQGAVISLNPDEGILAIITGEDFDYLFSKDKVDSLQGKWTSGKSNLNVYSDYVEYDGFDLEIIGLIALQDGYGNLFPSVMFGNVSATFVASIDYKSTSLYEVKDEGALEFVDSFISKNDFAKMYGEYNYLGEYGIEKVELTSDNKLYVTVMNDARDNIEVREFEYNAFINDNDCPALEFIFRDVPVDIIYDGDGHCQIFTVVYLQKVFFDNQGLYGDTADSYLSVVDNKIKYNGSKMSIDSINGNVISGTIDGADATLTFESGSVTVNLDGIEFTLSKNAVQLDDFICDVQENVGDLGEDVKVTAEGIFMHYRNGAEDDWVKVTDFDYVIGDDGSVSIKFNYKAIYNYTIAIVDGVVVITGESSLPPIPVPPPLPF